MSFSPIPIDTKNAAVLRISMVAMRSGPFRLMVTIPSAKYPALLNNATHVTALLGEGDDEGKLLLLPAEDGIKVAALKHCYTIRLPANDLFPQVKLSAEDPDHAVHEHDGVKGLLLTLPGWALDQDAAAKLGVARAEEAATRKAERETGDADPARDYANAPVGTPVVHRAILESAGGQRSVRLRISSIAEAAGVSKATVLNCVTWLSANGMVARQIAGKLGDPDIYTPVRS